MIHQWGTDLWHQEMLSKNLCMRGSNGLKATSQLRPPVIDWYKESMVPRTGINFGQAKPRQPLVHVMHFQNMEFTKQAKQASNWAGPKSSTSVLAFLSWCPRLRPLHQWWTWYRQPLIQNTGDQGAKCTIFGYSEVLVGGSRIIPTPWASWISRVDQSTCKKEAERRIPQLHR